MARRPASASASRIRIEDEVWEEAFSSRLRSTRSGVAAVAPVRAAQPSRDPGPSARSASQSPRLRVAESPAGGSSRYERPPEGGRRTIRIEGRGADPLRASGRERAGSATSSVPRAMGGSPDRLAMWATLLGFLLVLVAILSSHF